MRTSNQPVIAINLYRHVRTEEYVQYATPFWTRHILEKLNWLSKCDWIQVQTWLHLSAFYRKVHWTPHRTILESVWKDDKTNSKINLNLWYTFSPNYRTLCRDDVCYTWTWIRSQFTMKNDPRRKKNDNRVSVFCNGFTFSRSLALVDCRFYRWNSQPERCMSFFPNVYECWTLNTVFCPFYSLVQIRLHKLNTFDHLFYFRQFALNSSLSWQSQRILCIFHVFFHLEYFFFDSVWHFFVLFFLFQFHLMSGHT